MFDETCKTSRKILGCFNSYNFQWELVPRVLKEFKYLPSPDIPLLVLATASSYDLKLDLSSVQSPA